MEIQAGWMVAWWIGKFSHHQLNMLSKRCTQLAQATCARSKQRGGLNTDPNWNQTSTPTARRVASNFDTRRQRDEMVSPSNTQTYNDAHDEDALRTVSSTMFSRWYAQDNPDPSGGSGDTVNRRKCQDSPPLLFVRQVFWRRQQDCYRTWRRTTGDRSVDDA